MLIFKFRKKKEYVKPEINFDGLYTVDVFLYHEIYA